MPKSSHPFLNIDFQILKIYSRGMIINGNRYYKDFLLRKNYYNSVNVYGRFFLDSDSTKEKYVCGSHFKEIIHLYHFDRNVRQLTLSLLIEAESNIKSTISHIFCKHYGNTESYFNKSSFLLFNRNGKPIHKNFNIFKRQTEKFEDIFKKYYTYSPHSINSVAHHRRKSRDIPFWVLVNYLTFGQIKHFYALLKPHVQDEIAKSFSDSTNKGYQIDSEFRRKEMLNFITCLNELRNRVAHDNTLVFFEPGLNVVNFPILNELRKIDTWNESERNKFFPILTCVQLFVSKSNFIRFQRKLDILINELLINISSIDARIILNKLGFPNEWKIHDNGSVK